MNYQQTAWDELSEILGDEHARNFMETFGGNRIYVQQIHAKRRVSVSQPGLLSVRSMLDAAGELVSIKARKLLGGLTIYVPLIESRDLPGRNEKIAEMRAGGASIREIVRAHGLCERRIASILRDAS